MIKLVILGNSKLAEDFFDYINKLNNKFVIIGLFINDLDYTQNLLNKNHLIHSKVVDSLKLLKYMDYDLGFSIKYNKKISKPYIDKANLGFWNIHFSYLMKIRGVYTNTFAILNRKLVNNVHGVTLHKMDEFIDNGDILDSVKFPIVSNDTAYDLFVKCNELAINMLKKNLFTIISNDYNLIKNNNDYIEVFLQDFPSKIIPKYLIGESFYDFVRALDFPGYDCAIYRDDNYGDIPLVIKSRDEFVLAIRIENYDFFTNKKL